MGIGGNEFRARLVEVRAQGVSDVPDALDRHHNALEFIAAPLKADAARMPQNTPHAVIGDGSPLPPCSTGSPATCRVARRTTTMSSTVVPTSSAVM